MVVVGVEEWDDIIKAFPLRLAPPAPPVVVVGVREWDDIIKAFLPLSIPLPPLWSNVVGDTTTQQRGVAAQFDNFPELHRCSLDCSAETLHCAKQRCGAADVAALCIVLPRCTEVHHSSAAACRSPEQRCGAAAW